MFIPFLVAGAGFLFYQHLGKNKRIPIFGLLETR